MKLGHECVSDRSLVPVALVMVARWLSVMITRRAHTQSSEKRVSPRESPIDELSAVQYVKAKFTRCSYQVTSKNPK